VWRELVETFWPEHEFRPGASEASLAEAELSLGHPLPADLRTLLAESDGVDWSEVQLNLIWPLEQIVKTNLEFRSPQFDLRETSMPFEPLVFFADAGDGDQFAFARVSPPRDRDVFAWNHMDDSRSWVAPDLRTVIEWFADGRVKT
jgi:hypothetical protein